MTGLSMDFPSVDDIRHLLTRFEQSIDDTARDLARGSDSGTWCASAPYYEKCRILGRLKACEGTDNDKAHLVQDYNRIVKRLDTMADNGGRNYRDLLLADLRNLVHMYYAETCYFHIYCGYQDVDDDFRRDLIAELTRNLSSHYDLSALGALIAVVDENALLDAEPVPGGQLYVACQLEESKSCSSPCDGRVSCSEKEPSPRSV
jgi:hypothetical protein